MESGEYDLAIRYARPEKTRTSSRALFDEHLLPVCAPGVAKRLGDDEACLTGTESLIWVTRETADNAWLDWDGWAARFGLEIAPRRHGIRFERWPAAMSHAFGGGGLLLAGLAMTLDYIRDGRLVAPFGTGKVIKAGYHYQLVFPSAPAKTRVQAAFESWIEDEAYRTRVAMDAFLNNQS